MTGNADKTDCARGENNSAPAISVIIPCYNCRLTLPETLDCILGQSLHTGTEIVAVNDGSTDGTDKILTDYAAKYGCIKVINQENSGVSAARNRGLEAACGKYVIFLDGDDLLESGSLDVIYAGMEETGADTGVFELSRFGYGGSQDNPVAAELSREKSISPGDPRLLWTFLTGNKCYRREFLIENNIEFPPVSYCEDGVFWVTVTGCSPAVTGIPGAKCRYRRNDPSLNASVTQTMSDRQVDDFIKANAMMLDRIEDEALKNEMRIKICRTIKNEFLRRLWQATDAQLEKLKIEYESNYSLLPADFAARLAKYDEDLGEPVFSRQAAADNPGISVRIKNPSGAVVGALYNQTMPLFEICEATGFNYPPYENINGGKAKSGTVITLKGSECPDPRLLRAILLMKRKFPFSLIPSQIIKTVCTALLKRR